LHQAFTCAYPRLLALKTVDISDVPFSLPIVVLPPEVESILRSYPIMIMEHSPIISSGCRKFMLASTSFVLSAHEQRGIFSLNYCCGKMPDPGLGLEA